MIIPGTGEINFHDGLRIAAHAPVTTLLHALPSLLAPTRPLPVPGWNQHILQEHGSDYGIFEVEVASGPERLIEGVFLSHRHPFYEPGTPEDSERRAFHNGIIASDLLGQREFSWGHVFCRLDKKTNQDWLVVIYSPFNSVPLHQREIYKVLFEHGSDPNP